MESEEPPIPKDKNNPKGHDAGKELSSLNSGSEVVGNASKLPSTHSPPIPREIILLPLKEKPVFPGMFVPFVFPADPFEPVFKEIMKKRFGYVGMALEKGEDHDLDTDTVNVGENSFYRIGTLGRVINVLSTSADKIQVIISFSTRFFILDMRKKEPTYIARIRSLEEMQESDLKSREKNTLKGYTAALMSKVKELIKMNSVFSEELKILVSRYSSQSLPIFVNLLISLLTVPKPQELQKLLEIGDLIEKILSLLDYLHREVEVFKVKNQINQQIEEKVSGQQREFFLREQLKYIQKELKIGTDEKDLALTKIEEKVRSLPLSEEARKVVEGELERLKLYDSKSAEFGVAKNYIDWILSLPWLKNGIDKDYQEPDLDRARKILNLHHYGLENVKTKLLEFLSVEKLRKKPNGSILCFVGPPGVGKTSLGKSLSEAMGRKFYRFSVGGMRDEAEIKGHRRTYVGAMPGKIIQALKAVGTHNPIILIDEIDKLVVSYQGDPASALLEVLDPEQNKDFLDHYLDIRFDLSKIFFITTANQLETIPGPLKDRMEIIHLISYIAEEKKHIAKKYLIPRQREENGLMSKDFSFTSQAIEELIEYYTAEAGVRGLERMIRNLLRKIAHLKAGHDPKKPFEKVLITPTFLEKNLEEPRTKDPFIHNQALPGVVCGLAWTPLGGTILYIEAITVADQISPGFKLTGQLGGVMEESAQIAYSYARSLATIYPEFQIAPPKNMKKGEVNDLDFFARKMIHLHVPSGATPKDGPSAGIAMALALSSLALGKKVKTQFAMTGEITLSGKVLPIGGLKEKLIAAKKNHKTKVLVPKDNYSDVKKINTLYPLHLKGLKIFYVEHFFEVLHVTLGFKPKKHLSSL